MLQSIRCKHLITIVFIYVVIIFTGAFVVKTNLSPGNDGDLLLDVYGQTTESSLSFLDGFVIENSVESPLIVESYEEKKRIFKRSISTHSVPQYMLDVYEHLHDKRIQLKFDTARSFHSSTNQRVSTGIPSDTRGKTYTFHRMMFNVSHFPSSEIALFAQLRIQVANKKNDKDFGSKKIETYLLWDDSSILLDSKHFNPSEESLFTVNVTISFQKAVESKRQQIYFEMLLPSSFSGLLSLDLESVEGPQLLVLSKTVRNRRHDEDRILTRMRRSLEEKDSGNTMVTDSMERTLNKTEVPWRHNSQRRSKRSEEEDEEAEEQSNYIVEELGRIRKGKLKRKKNPCRRKPLHVNFAAINYDQWIIAPPSYEAFECTGRCSFPMSAHLAPTKHAIIQTLVHSLEPKQVSRACCVPIKLAPISILYVEDDGTVTYKYDYEDMVVAECGCR